MGLIPSSRQARITRTAISPRLAISSFRNILHSPQRVVFGWLGPALGIVSLPYDPVLG